MDKLIFANKGEIDPRLITTLGVNVKEGPSSIGFFGTGLKYAIAVTLRLGGSVTIHSGEQTYTFSLDRATIRGKAFDFIQMNGQVLGFTTELGKTWEPWMAYREFYCNAKDEGGDVEQHVDTPEACPDRTYVIVECQALLDAHAERSLFILSRALPWRNAEAEIGPHSSTAIFYRGIKVAAKCTIGTYNVLATQQIREDRTVDLWGTRASIARGIVESVEDVDFIKAVLQAQENAFEHSLDFDWYNFKPSAAFLEATGSVFRAEPLRINKSAVQLASRSMDTLVIPERPMSQVERRMLEKAQAFLLALGYDLRPYRIKCVEDLGANYVGLARNNEITLSHGTFEKGTKFVTSTLLEEFIHLSKGFSDGSREMQNWLFDKLISMGEELSGEPL